MDAIKSAIRVVKDFPKPGINYLDITTLLIKPELYTKVIDVMAEQLQEKEVDKLVAIEARGFIPAASLAEKLKLPLVLVRKQGKLPSATVSITYDLEYGSDCLEMHIDSLNAGDRVAIIDDVLATGGTVNAVCKLVEQQQAQVVSINAIIGLSFLSYQEKLRHYVIDTVVDYSET